MSLITSLFYRLLFLSLASLARITRVLKPVPGTTDGSLAYFDDHYIDTTGVNLNLPADVGVPEPASLALLELGACSMFLSRRRA